MLTVPNPDELDIPSEFPDVKYAAWQEELSESGLRHYQCYVIFNNTKTIVAVKKICKGHWEIRQATHAQALVYVTKEKTRVDGPWFIGTPPQAGKRTDLVDLKTALDDGKTAKEISDCPELFGTWCNHWRAVDRYIGMHAPERTEHTFCQVYWGESGVGKTRRARYEAVPSALWLNRANCKSGALWYDGYTGQEVLVIDEFTGWLPRQVMLRMIDRTPFTVQVKGGWCQFMFKKIIITSNLSPDQWWQNIGLGDMMIRRLSGNLGSVEHMVDEWVSPEELADDDSLPPTLPEGEWGPLAVLETAEDAKAYLDGTPEGEALAWAANDIRARSNPNTQQ